MQISEAVKADYQQAMYWRVNHTTKTMGGRVAVRLADALRDTLAELLHEQSRDAQKVAEWSPENWQAEAERMLRGDKT
jgi:hypothetical protein